MVSTYKRSLANNWWPTVIRVTERDSNECVNIMCVAIMFHRGL